VVYTCDCTGQHNHKGKAPQVDRSKKCNNTGSKKCGCLMRVVLGKCTAAGVSELHSLNYLEAVKLRRFSCGLK
jgi:hypothetical protein